MGIGLAWVWEKGEMAEPCNWDNPIRENNI